MRLPEHKDIPKSSPLEPQPTQLVEQTGEHSQGLEWWWGQLGSLDHGLTINSLTPDLVDVHYLDVRPLSNLSDGILSINGLRGVFSSSLGYVIIRVHVEGVQGYDEDQVALVILDSIGFGSWILVTLGTPTIKQIINMIKESEINELSVSLNGSRINQLLACWQAELLIWKETVANQAADPTNLDKTVKTTKKEEVDAFSSKIIYGWMKTLLLGNNMYVMTQSLEGGEGPCLPNGLSVVNTCTEVISGSKQVIVVVKNLTAFPITIAKGVKITQVFSANAVPPVKITPDTLE